VIEDAVEVDGEPGVNSLRIKRLAGSRGADAGPALVYASDVLRVYRCVAP
jgi:hypothetical protein